MSSHPTPKPGPRPGPRPGTAARRSVAPAVTTVRRCDPAQWGRADDNGNIYVTTHDGERLVGCWQAGTPAEGLAHYGARFDDVATEVELLETRLRAHPEEAPGIRKSAQQLAATLPTAAIVGDIADLERRLSAVQEQSVAAEAKAKEEKQQRRATAIARKEELAAEAESIGESATEWKEAGDRLHAILDEWKTIRGVDRKTDDALWKRYSRARDAFNRRRGAHFAELDRGRAVARRTKEDLVERAEALKTSTEWGETARAFRDLMSEWKVAGRAPRDIDDKLWKQFKAAQDFFFDARNAEIAQKDKEFEENAVAKQALIDEYSPRINPQDDLEGARATLRELQEKWEEIGYVPRGRVREFEDKIAVLEARVSEAADSQWRRTDPEAQARAAQFAHKAEEFSAQAEHAAAQGNEKKAQQLRAQATQWSEWAEAARSAIEER